MFSYIVIPRDLSFAPTSTLADFVGTATGPELAARLVAELNNPRYTVADCEEGDRIEVDAGPCGWQMRVRSHGGHLMGSPGIVLSPLRIRSTWRVTESTCIDAADRVVEIARDLTARHGLSVAIAPTDQLRWAFSYSLIDPSLL